MRLFVALWPDDAVRHWLAQLPDAGGQPVAPVNLHMTLAFLGEQPASAVPHFHDLLRTLPRQSFELRIDRLDRFIAQGEAILWAGPATSPPALNALQVELMTRLDAGGFDVAHDAMRFIPHITLARRAPLSRAGTDHIDPPIFWSPHAPVLVHSQPGTSGPQYRLLPDRGGD